MTTLLNVHEVSKRFGQLQALGGINLKVDKGEIRALLGPNGAGKTTLFNLISGMFTPSEGSIHFNDVEISHQSVEQRVRTGIVRTFQITEVFKELSVYENLRIAVEAEMGVSLRPWISRAQRQDVKRRLDELLEATQLGGKAGREVGELAHGDQRVVEVAMALAMDPRLLLLDEPTAGMSDHETDHMVELIKRLHQTFDLTVLFVEHDMHLVFNLAHRITVLDNGRLLAEGTPREIADNERVQEAYLGSSTI
ncbi:ABC transporter ATP-binding protein [Acidihalobacter prosperus]|uniref:Branched-chain amino acid transport ATP-binding protein LivG n=1 Tax=Acidihalobacter prosperus TaxID=160660 RepID=A0A1A6C4F7_9GAMM|nr:ABC transporter ATP-binding protein [Acidihalobacter prosperus]OBS09425.1 Branched-chain amino acid transport ATP-binding protein LivG [Acidihalobacter prosperus]